jgi:hypothetical protein
MPILDLDVPMFVDPTRFHQHYCKDLALAAAQKYFVGIGKDSKNRTTSIRKVAEEYSIMPAAVQR